MPVSAPEVVPCVGALVYDESARLLVIKRGKEPDRGLWSLPGGRVQAGETLAEAVVREVLEETGLVVEAGAIVGSVERDGPDGKVYAITDIAGATVGGTLHAGDDADDARFVDVAELGSLPLSPGLLDALLGWGAMPAAVQGQPPSP